MTVSATDVPSGDDPDDTDEELVHEAIAWYQGAGLLFRSGGLAALPLRKDGLAALQMR